MRRLLALLLSFAFLAPAHAQEPASAPVRVRFETTAGPFVIELDPSRAPLGSANFLEYVRTGHYDGTIFHRVIAGFVAQAGGYAPDGAERPTRAPLVNESGNGLSNLRGTVAMARTGDPHSATSQFYVNLVDNQKLDPQPSRWGYAVIGRVVEGMEVVDRIGTVETGSRGPFPVDTPLEPVVIKSAKVTSAAP